MENRPNKRQQQYQTTLENIRASVDRLVSDLGFDAMRIQDITKEAGISPGAFYHYFSSKDDLLRDRYTRLNTYQRRLYDEKLVHLPPIDALKTFFTEMEAYTRSRNVDIFRQFIKVSIDQQENWAEDEAPMTLVILEALVEKGLAQGSIAPRYTRQEMVDFLYDYHAGVNQAFCATRGKHLEGKSALPILLDWIENLRA